MQHLIFPAIHFPVHQPDLHICLLKSSSHLVVYLHGVDALQFAGPVLRLVVGDVWTGEPKVKEINDVAIKKKKKKRFERM